MSEAVRREQLVRAYIEQHGFAAITVADPAAGAVVAVAAEGFDWRGRFAAVWWLAHADKARALVGGIPAGLSAEDAARRIEVAAERAGIRLTPHSTMMQRAAGAVALIDQRIRGMQAKGDLKSLNAEYQDFRLRRKETGGNAPPYWRWLHAKKLEMVKAVALAAAGKRPVVAQARERLDQIPTLPASKRAQRRALKPNGRPSI